MTASPTTKNQNPKKEMAISAAGTIALILFGVICLVYVTWFLLATIWARAVTAMAMNIRARRVNAAAAGGAAAGDAEAGAGEGAT